MDRKNILLEQLSASHNSNGWFVSFQSAIEGLSPNNANWKECEGTNSILEIVNHLNFWNARYLNRFLGIENKEMTVENRDTFFGELSWKDAVEEFNTLMCKWKKVIADCEDDKLDSIVPEQSGTWVSTLTHLCIHNAYHIGQIVSIRKQQGSWDEKFGVH
ncbi:DinB family protein [Cytobacillus sp. FJAT-54145]|uniref:DinB family protein n=1 Tax=Cytobacillus spartinae TaxID=3299023 RepID=A0ABW6KFA0_9BACI